MNGAKNGAPASAGFSLPTKPGRLKPALRNELRRIRLLIVCGRAIAAILAVAAFAAALWLAFAGADALAAFEPGPRHAITIALLISTALVAVIALIRAVSISTAQAAARADAASGDLRRPATAALSLAPTDSPLGEMLARRTTESAATSVAAVPAGKIFPWRQVGISLAALAVVLAAVGTFRLAAPGAFATLTARLLHPSADIPPYSPLVFKVEPQNPSATYGGELQVSADISGAEILHPVECLIRVERTGEILHLPAFKESPTRFSRKLDGLTEPVSIAIASGKARSRWVPVEILLEPKILAGTAKITPPAYTGEPEASFPLDTNEIAAIEGSRIVLELASNRPLSGGTLVFTPATAPGTEPIPQTIEATVSAPDTASFAWTAARPGKISAIVRDLRGTPSPAPLELALRVIPDRPPVVELTSPPRQLLATPRSIIPISGTAEDDFSLASLQFARTLSGFRDRIRVVAPDLREKHYEFRDKLNLYDLGLEAGQTIELTLEAADHNPSLLGHGSSEISRIRIISEDQYAEYIRTKTTLAEFNACFQAARDAVDRARKSLEKLRDATDPKALDEARDAHAKAADLLEKIADDFPAFELEKRLQDLAREQAAELRKNLAELDKFQPGDGIGEMLDRLGKQQAPEKQLDADVALARDAASILEMAAKFRRIYENQQSLAKRFGTIVRELQMGQDQNRRLLPSLADTQRKNRADLDAFKKELQRRLDGLAGVHPELDALTESAADFLEKLTAAAPETLMDSAAEYGAAGRASEAAINAELARAMLERLLAEKEPFPEAAMGQAPKFDPALPDLNDTIEQLLKSLLGQNPGEQGGGAPGGPGGQGAGAGGFGANGAAMNGIPMNLPVVGPDRLRFDPLASSSSDSGNGKGTPKPVAPLPDSAESGIIKAPPTRSGEAGGISPESIPEPYREAVKRFLTP